MHTITSTPTNESRRDGEAGARKPRTTTSHPPSRHDENGGGRPTTRVSTLDVLAGLDAPTGPSPTRTRAAAPAAGVVGPDAHRSRAGRAVSIHTANLEEEGLRFADVAAAGDLGAPIATCPGWTVRDLVEHLGLVHLWAAANIAFPSDRWLTVRAMSDLRPYWPELTDARPTDDEFVDWYRRSLNKLIGILDSTSAEHQCLSFLPAPSPVHMWARRQASETAIHRRDAEIARGLASPIETGFALDMLDELLVGFATLMCPSDSTSTTVLNVEPIDADASFSIRIGPRRIRTTVERSEHADLRLTGTAADLAVLLWNRPAGASVRTEGDPNVLDLWRTVCRIHWR